MEGTVNITISQLDDMRNKINNQKEVIEELKKAKSNNIVYFRKNSNYGSNEFYVSTKNEFLQIYNDYVISLKSEISVFKSLESELNCKIRNLRDKIK